MKITLYSKDNCPACKMAKRLLDGSSVAYEEVNIEGNWDKIAELKEQGIGSLPATFYEGVEGLEDSFIVGFNPTKLKDLVRKVVPA